MIYEVQGLCLSIDFEGGFAVERCEVGNGVVVNGEQSGDIIAHTNESVCIARQAAYKNRCGSATTEQQFKTNEKCVSFVSLS